MAQQRTELGSDFGRATLEHAVVNQFDRDALPEPMDATSPSEWLSEDFIEELKRLRVAVLLPCKDEEVAIASVISDFRRVLPHSTVYVYDNASSDLTAASARAAGAVVHHVPLPGKGNVVRRMFADIDADVYVLTDGDGTYDPDAAPRLIERLLRDHLDMVIGTRDGTSLNGKAYRRGHQLGNRVLTRSVRWLFRGGSADMLSGYRVFSRRFVKSFPALSRGFEIETEMTVHALELRLPFEDVATDYSARLDGSRSKLRSVPDGFRILKFILLLWKDYRPLGFFCAVALLSEIAALASAWHGRDYLHTWSPWTFGFVGFTAFASLALLGGIVLNSLSRTQRELKRMLYLAISQRNFPAALEARIDDR
jgi:glycosyltransferase involved in cell wall biosynthesis